MPNHVENIITLKGDEKRIREMLEAIKNDDFGLGTLDFNKIIPMPNSLNIEAGSRTDKGLKAYSDFIDVYVFGRNAEDALNAIQNIPKEIEGAFLKQRTDVKIDEWELGKPLGTTFRITELPLGTNGVSTTGVQNGIPMVMMKMQITVEMRICGFRLHGQHRTPYCKNCPKCIPILPLNMSGQMKIWVQTVEGKFTETANAPRNIIPKTKKKPLNSPVVSGTTILPSLI